MPRRLAVFVTALLVLVVGLEACTPAAQPTATPVPAPTKAASSALPTAAAPASTAAPKPPSAPTAAPTAKPATVKFGSIQSLSDAGVYIAIEKGYFNEQNITTQIENFRAASETIAPIGTGQLDVASIPVSASLLAAADRGVNLKIVSDKGQGMPKWEFTWIVLRKDLADSGKVKTASDLRGMKVAIPSLGSLGEQTTQLFLEQSGVKPEDVEMTVLPSAEQAAALGNKAIAAAYTSDPYIARGIQEGFSVKWIPNSQPFGGRVQTSTLVFGSALLKDKDLAQRWMVAYLKGVRDYLKAFTVKEGRDEVVKILTKYSTVKDPKLYDLMEMPYLDPNGTLDKKSMDIAYKWLVDKGIYKGKTTFEGILDMSYADYAAQKLGKQ